MTRAVRDQMLKDANGSISDHLRNHIHLTNCIHLKNHMHKHSPILSNRALMRDLVALQRSRSLRDPSASPTSQHSHSVADILLKRGQRDDLVGGRLSVGKELPDACGRMSKGSPPVAGISASKSAIGKLSRHNDGEAAGLSNCDSKDVIHQCRRVKREEPIRRSSGYPQDGNDLVQNTVSGNTELGNKIVEIKGGLRQDRHLKTLSDQLKDIATESDDAASSPSNGDGMHNPTEKFANAGADFHRGSGPSRSKRHRFRGARRRRRSRAPQQAVTQNEMSLASNSFSRGRAHQKYNLEEGFREQNDQDVNGVPQNGCGIPWNWSRIHDRGKSFLDLAGRSLSCGLSESRFKRGGSTSRRMDIPEMPLMSELSSSSAKSNGEGLPLLLDASGSRGSIDHASWVHGYSGELGIFSDNLLKQEVDCDLTSEGRSGEQHRLRKHHNGRHKNLTQKYMPRTFRDLVGQNLVVQALSNAITKRKVGSLYLFYGPHGTGKTSCARIFARALNCQSLEHPKPCGYCNSCTAQATGKNQYVKEIGPVGNINLENILKFFTTVTSQLQSQYKVLIFDACDTSASECWKAILKVIDRAPRRVIFILVCSSLEAVPHLIISRCQKFFFPKLKDADIIYTLQWIATKEDLEIDKDALKVIASRSDGSLRDAEMTLEQLSLLGKRISLDMVQELAGLISDEKLIDLLDLALSADTVNTVKNLRDIMGSGVDPLALMSQLAAVITDILAGSHNFINERPRRKFFRRQALSKEDMEKLRQALKTLSEAEKQLRVSNDRITWLTAALLQLAPDQQYLLPKSSAEASFTQSPLVSNNALIERPRKSNADMPAPNGGGTVSRKLYPNKIELRGQEIDEIWWEVLEKIPNNSVKEFLGTEGKLISINYATAPTVQLLFNSELTKSKAERFKPYISQAFESVFGSPVAIEIQCDSRKDAQFRKIQLPATQDPSPLDADHTICTSNGIPAVTNNEIIRSLNRDASYSGVNRREIVEIVEKTDWDKRNIGNSVGVTPTTPNASTLTHERNQSLSLVRSRLPLAHVIQQEGSSEHGGWSKRKAVSIAEKLEQENLRLEPRSRRLRCWNPPKGTCRKLSRLKIRTRKPQALLRFVSCGRCLSSQTPR